MPSVGISVGRLEILAQHRAVDGRGVGRLDQSCRRSCACGRGSSLRPRGAFSPSGKRRVHHPRAVRLVGHQRALRAFVVHVLSLRLLPLAVTDGTGTHAWVAPPALAISTRVTTSNVRQRPGVGVNERSWASAMPCGSAASGSAVAVDEETAAIHGELLGKEWENSARRLRMRRPTNRRAPRLAGRPSRSRRSRPARCADPGRRRRSSETRDAPGGAQPRRDRERSGKSSPSVRRTAGCARRSPGSSRRSPRRPRRPASRAAAQRRHLRHARRAPRRPEVHHDGATAKRLEANLAAVEVTQHERRRRAAASRARRRGCAALTLATARASRAAQDRDRERARASEAGEHVHAALSVGFDARCDRDRSLLRTAMIVDSRRTVHTMDRIVERLVARPGAERARARRGPARDARGDPAEVFLRSRSAARSTARSASCPSTTRRAPSARSSTQHRDDIARRYRHRRAVRRPRRRRWLRRRKPGCRSSCPRATWRSTSPPTRWSARSRGWRRCFPGDRDAGHRDGLHRRPRPFAPTSPRAR